MPPPLIGITGGIGTGKSTAIRMLGELGAVTFSADEAAREILLPGSEALQEVVAAFGETVLHSDGRLNRERLAEIVFADPEARERLEAITHPRILELMRTWIDATRNQNPAAAAIVIEVPLLFEAGMEDWFNRIVVVTASEPVQLERLKERGLTVAKAKARINSQIPLADKAARAHIVINNSGTLGDLETSVRQAWREIVAHAESVNPIPGE